MRVNLPKNPLSLLKLVNERHFHQRSSTSHHSVEKSKSDILAVNSLDNRLCLCVQMVLKCADIGHLAAAPETHKRWAYQLEEEFFRQACCLVMPAYAASIDFCMHDRIWQVEDGSIDWHSMLLLS